MNFFDYSRKKRRKNCWKNPCKFFFVSDLPFSAIYWSLYEYNKKIFLPDHVERRGAARSANDEELLELAEKQAEVL